MMMRNKISFLFLVLLSVVIQTTSIDSYNRKGSSVLDRQYQNDDDTENEKQDYLDNNYREKSTYRRNRYSPYGSSSNNYRSRSRWPSSYDDSSDSNDWSRQGYGLEGRLPNFPGPFSPAAAGAFEGGPFLNNAPSCYSLLDSQYPLFSDICGAVPQARYSLPNSFGHLERWQIAQILTTILGPSTPASSNPACTRSLRLLLCPLLFPPCPTRYEAPPVLPCQPFCRAIKNQCGSPSLDLLPCDLLPPTSDLCPINPTPYSSLLSSFGPPLPFNGGLPPSALSSILAQSAMSSGLSPFDLPPAALSRLLPPSGIPSPAFAQLLSSSGLSPAALSSLLSSSGLPPSGLSPFASPSPFNPQPNMESYMADSLAPILVDFPPLQYANEYRQAPRYFPLTRSATEKA